MFPRACHLIPVLSQMHPVHTFLPYFCKVHSNFILTPTLRSSKQLLAFRFSNQNIVCISRLIHACYKPTYLILLDLITLIIFGKGYKF